jgi:hypothetical protein
METTNNIERFNFFVPTTIVKGVKTDDKTGTEVETYKFEGLASDGTRDLDKETMKDCMFILDERPVVNWNHKPDPEYVMGALTDWTAKRGHLFVKGELYPELPKARATINLMEALEKRGKKTLGISVEGQVLERDLLDKTKIRKAKVNAVALCLIPKNGSTWAKLVKSFSEGEVIYQDPKTFVYEEVDDLMVRFVSENGSELLVKSDGSIEFDVKLTEQEKDFITLVKAYQENILSEKQQQDLINFYKNFVVVK